MANNQILSGVWVLNETLESIISPQYINFSFSMNGTKIEAKAIGQYSTSPSWLCYFRTTNIYDDFYIAYENDKWNDEKYRTITIDENQDNDKFLAWLQVNAIKKFDNVEGLTDEIKAVKDIFTDVGEAIRTKYEGLTVLPKLQPSEFAQKIRAFTGQMSGQTLNDYLQEYMKNIADSYELEGSPYKVMFLIDFTDVPSYKMTHGSSDRVYSSDGKKLVNTSGTFTFTNENAVEMVFENKVWKVGWLLVFLSTNTSAPTYTPPRNLQIGYYQTTSWFPIYRYYNDSSKAKTPRFYSFPSKVHLATSTSNATYFAYFWKFNNQNIKFTISTTTYSITYFQPKNIDTLELEFASANKLISSFEGLEARKIILTNYKGWSSAFISPKTEEIYGFDLINTTSTVSLTSGTVYTSLTYIEFLNIKVNITFSTTSAGVINASKKCLIDIIKELVNTGTAHTFSIGSVNMEKIADVYVRLTGEAEVDETLPKLPFEICNADDEGAMLITEYAALKNWTIA